MSNNIQQYCIIIMIDDDHHRQDHDHDLHQVQLHVQHHSGQRKPSTRMCKSRYSAWGAFGKTYDRTGTEYLVFYDGKDCDDDDNEIGDDGDDDNGINGNWTFQVVHCDKNQILFLILYFFV